MGKKRLNISSCVDNSTDTNRKQMSEVRVPGQIFKQYMSEQMTSTATRETSVTFSLTVAIQLATVNVTDYVSEDQERVESKGSAGGGQQCHQPPLVLHQPSSDSTILHLSSSAFVNLHQSFIGPSSVFISPSSVLHQSSPVCISLHQSLSILISLCQSSSASFSLHQYPSVLH